MGYAPPTRVMLISHAATSAQKAGFFPLDDALEVLPVVRWEAPRHARALVSPERRTQQTAEALGLEAVVAPELRECDFGAWAGRWLEGLPVEELMQWLGDVDAAPHGGESFGGLMRRVGAWLDGVRDDGPMVVVTHATVVRAAVVWALLGSAGEAFLRVEVAPLTVTELRWSGGMWRAGPVGAPLIAEKSAG